MTADTKQTEGQVPACRECRYFFITHEPTRPYGCRAMRFKSKHNPALVVFAASGMQCQLFRPKVRRSPGTKNGGTDNA